MILTDIVSLIGDAFPLPDFTVKEQVQKWLEGMNDELACIIADLAKAYEKTGRIDIELPAGEVASFFIGANGKPCMNAEHQDALTAAVSAIDLDVGAWGDGTILSILKQLLPILLQILPFLVKRKEPTPPPAPPVV
jgi:hypothetical protein